MLWRKYVTKTSRSSFISVAVGRRTPGLETLVTWRRVLSNVQSLQSPSKVPGRYVINEWPICIVAARLHCWHASPHAAMQPQPAGRPGCRCSAVGAVVWCSAPYAGPTRDAASRSSPAHKWEGGRGRGVKAVHDQPKNWFFLNSSRNN